MGTQLEIIPTPSANQQIILWYIPRLPQLLQDFDITTIGYSGWLEYVIVRSAMLALMKEESDVTMLVTGLADLRHRIESTAMNRDAGQPDTITNVRNSLFGWGGGGEGWGGGSSAGY